MSEVETKRLFIGFTIEMGSSLRSALKRTKIDAQKKEMEFFWPPESNYHVTLCFLGRTPATAVDEIQNIMREIASDASPFRAHLRGLGAFPDDHHMRTLFVGVRKNRPLAELQDQLQQALAARGWISAIENERVYKPHLTVGKLRKARSGADLISPYVRTTFDDVNVKRITLFETIMPGSHPVYHPVFQIDLTGRNEISAVSEPRYEHAL